MRTVQLQFDINIYNDDQKDQYYFLNSVRDFLKDEGAELVDDNLMYFD